MSSEEFILFAFSNGILLMFYKCAKLNATIIGI